MVVFAAHWGGAGGEKDVAAPQIAGARWFSFAEVKKVTNNFASENEIGEGGYGKVQCSNGKICILILLLIGILVHTFLIKLKYGTSPKFKLVFDSIQMLCPMNLIIVRHNVLDNALRARRLESIVGHNAKSLYSVKNEYMYYLVDVGT